MARPFEPAADGPAGSPGAVGPRFSVAVKTKGLYNNPYIPVSRRHTYRTVPYTYVHEFLLFYSEFHFISTQILFRMTLLYPRKKHQSDNDTRGTTNERARDRRYTRRTACVSLFPNRPRTAIGRSTEKCRRDDAGRPNSILAGRYVFFFSLSLL